MRIINNFTLVFCLLTSNLFAQSVQQEIRLLDLESSMPIALATFEYGDQQGVSDENGIIRFRSTEGEIMILSHVSFGSWSLDDEQLKNAVKNQVYYRKNLSVDISPVMIIAVNARQQPEESVSIDYEERMAHDAATILNQEPAFNSIRKGGNYGFDPVFRGFKYDQLNVVLNGAQSATAACPNRMDPPTSQMAPNMLDRIEILKGPYAMRYGTGIGATINFVPAKLRFTDNPDVYGRASLAYESNGNIPRGETQIGLSGNKYDINLFSSWSQGDDYKAGNGETVQADFKRGSFGTNLGFKLSANQQIRVSAIYNRARDADFPALAMDLRKDDTWMLNARHDIQVNGDRLQSWNSTVFGSFVDHLMDNLLKPLDPRMLNAKTPAKTYNYGGRTEGVWKFGHDKLYSGADLRIEGARGVREREYLMGPMAGKTFEDNVWQDSRISKAALFAEYQTKGKSFDYVASGRLEFNVAYVNDPTAEFTQVFPETQVTQVNPGFSLGILKDLGAKIQTGLWVARAQRSGGLTERFINYLPVGQDPYEMLGNPQLKPEINYQADLTFKWNINDGSVVDLDIYAAYLQDYISSVIDPTLTPKLPMDPGVRRYVNIDDAFKTGFEVSWSQQLVAGLAHRLGIAYTYAQDLQRDEPLPEIAPLDIRYSLYGRYLKNRLKPEITILYAAEQSRVSSEFGETVTPSFALLDVKLGYQVTKQLSFNVGVNNLFDENYYEHLNRSVLGTNNSIFAPGRNFFTNLNFTF